MRKILSALISFLCAFFWLVIMLSFSDPKMTFITLSAALFHETGHISALWILKKDFSMPRAVSSGFRIKSSSKFSYREEILVAFGGPFANLLLSLIFAKISPLFSVVNLATAVCNLLPMKSFDGYKIAYDLIAIFFGYEISEKIMMHLSVFVCAAMVFLSLFTIMIFNGGYWIFFVFFIVFIKEILFFQKQINFEH